MTDKWHRLSSMALSIARSKTFWITAPIVTPIIYIIWLDIHLSRTTQSTSGPYGSGKLESSSHVPQEAPIHDSKSLVFHEKVTKSVAQDEIPPELQKDLDELLTTYLRGNMLVFASLPQAIMIRRLMSDPHDRATFDALHLDEIAYVPGDLVCGVYRIVRRNADGAHRVELLMDAPESYRGHHFEGIMVVGLAADSAKNEIVFKNEVWMWRKEGEPKVPIESVVGRHLHLFFVKWLVDKQVRQMTQSKRGT